MTSTKRSLSELPSWPAHDAFTTTTCVVKTRLVTAKVVAVLTELKQVRVETDDGRQYAITENTPGINWRLLNQGQWVECVVTTSALPRVLEARALI